jgi:uncharacterized delta-60 repeat protein
MSQVVITSITANTPVDIYYCNSFSASCVFVSTVSVFPYEFSIPSPYSEDNFIIKIIDSVGCIIGDPIFVTPTPTSSLTPTPTPTNTITPTITITSTPTNTKTPTNTPTNTETPTNTPTNSVTPTQTPAVAYHYRGQNSYTTSGDVCNDVVTILPYYTYISESNTIPVINATIYETLLNGVLYNPFNGEDKFYKMSFGEYFYWVQIDINGDITSFEVCANSVTPTPTPTPTPTNTETPTNTPTPTQTPQYKFLPNGAYLLDSIDNNSSAYFYGYFTGYSQNNSSSKHIIKLNQDLTIDYSFNVGTGFNGVYYNGESILQQPDGKIIATGAFSSYNGTSSTRIIRLNTDGSVDTSFVTGSGFVGTAFPYTLRTGIDSLGNIYVPGRYTQYNGVSVPMGYLAKLNSSGVMDMTFSATNSFNTVTIAVLINDDDSLYVTGYFSSFSGISANRIIKLQSNGYKDTSFNYGTGFNSSGDNPNGFLRISGETSFYVYGYAFSQYNGVPANNIIKLNSDGTVDYSFTGGTGFNGAIYSSSFIVWSNKLLLSGGFTSYNGTTSLYYIILNSDGTVFQSFTTEYEVMFTIGNKLYASEPDGPLVLLMTYP